MLKYYAKYDGDFLFSVAHYQLSNTSHFISPLSLNTQCPQQWTHKKKKKYKIIFKHFCQFSRWLRRAKSGVANLSIAATTFSIFCKFQTKLFGFPFNQKELLFINFLLSPRIQLLFFTGICTKS